MYLILIAYFKNQSRRGHNHTENCYEYSPNEWKKKNTKILNRLIDANEFNSQLLQGAGLIQSNYATHGISMWIFTTSPIIKREASIVLSDDSWHLGARRYLVAGLLDSSIKQRAIIDQLGSIPGRWKRSIFIRKNSHRLINSNKKEALQETYAF